MLQILHIIGSLNMGGAETFLINLYRAWDRSKVQFDFAVYDQAKGENYYEEVAKLGGKVYYLPSKSEGILKNIIAVKNLVEKNQYSIVWRHTNSCVGGLDLLGAKLGGAEKIILHSHSSKTTGIEKPIHYLIKPFINAILTERFACGQKAGEWMYGKRKFEIVKNGIDTEKYRYNQEVRDQYRREFGVSEKLVLGHVGRFVKVKNHEFLLKILAYMVTINQDVVLFLIGEGSLEEQIREKAKEMGVLDYIRFLETRNDIANLMQMFDVFVLPSLYEGFPMTLVEAQISGLPCVVSSAVSFEVKLSENLEFIDIDAAIETWGNTIIQLAKKDRHDNSRLIAKEGYDIKNIVRKIEELVKI